MNKFYYTLLYIVAKISILQIVLDNFQIKYELLQTSNFPYNLYAVGYSTNIYILLVIQLNKFIKRIQFA